MTSPTWCPVCGRYEGGSSRFTRRALDIAFGLFLLGVEGGVAAYVFPIHERLYAWPFLALALFATTYLVGLALAIGLIVGRAEGGA